MTASLPSTRPAPLGGAVVQVSGVVHVYRVAGTDVAALRGVDLTIDAGDQVALLGPSGSGKSTLLSVIAGLLPPSAGRVLVDGHDIARDTERELSSYRADTVGLMLQGAMSNLVPYASATQNLRYVSAGRPSAGTGRDVLAEAGLVGSRVPVARLNRAEQQAVALAVAMITGPRLLLVDEPTSQLDDDSRDRLLDILVRTTAAVGTTLLVVTHDEHVANRLGRLVRMREGRVGSEGRRQRQFPVIGTDGSIQLPEDLLATWPAGRSVEVTAVSAGELRIVLRSQGVGDDLIA